MKVFLNRLVLVLVFIAACHGATSRLRVSSPPTTSSPAPMPTVPISRFPSGDLDLGTMLSPLPPICEEASSSTSPLGRLRHAMRSEHTFFDAYIVFYTDEHLSDEPAPDERRLEYISGWDGEGKAVVLGDGDAAIWVPSGDVRRARATLSCAWQVMDADGPPSVSEWLAERWRSVRGGRISRTYRVGADARLAAVKEWQDLSDALQLDTISFVDVSAGGNAPSLLDQVWNEEPDETKRRPEPSRIVANVHNPEYAGKSWRDKLSLVRKELSQAGADAMVVTALDEVAWLLNVRGRDVPYAPLLKAFVIVSFKDVRVYAPPGKLPMTVREALAGYNCYSSNCTRVNDYQTFYADLKRSNQWNQVLIPEAGTFQRGSSAAVYLSVPSTKRMYQPSPIIFLKAMKDKKEIKGMKEAHLKDAVAMCTLLSYLEGKIREGLTEVSVGKKVDVTRETQAGHIGLSMRTRVSFGPNGADPHYRPTNVTNRRIFANSTLVIQSGGQYDEGTTLVTRTLHYGYPSRDERRAYTTTLRSLAALATMRIPYNLPAAHTDPVARAPLWEANQDYTHPSGHGVGAAMNRREDPVVIDYRQDTNLHQFKEGYFITNEPSWYEPYKFGIKLGNILQVVTNATVDLPATYLWFREMTMVPFEPKLIDKSMLTEYEINWLNEYNSRIRKEVGLELKGQGLINVYYWMMNKTIPIEAPSKMRRLTCNSAHADAPRDLAILIIGAVVANFMF